MKLYNQNAVVTLLQSFSGLYACRRQETGQKSVAMQELQHLWIQTPLHKCVRTTLCLNGAWKAAMPQTTSLLYTNSSAAAGLQL